MKWFAVGLIMLAALPLPAAGQDVPPGSYVRSCTDIRLDGDTLKALCRMANGAQQKTELHRATQCSGDITVDAAGILRCTAGRQAAPGYGSPAPGYGSPAPGYGSPAPGYGAPGPRAPEREYGSVPVPPPGYWRERRAAEEYCSRLRYRAREARERLDYAQAGERDRLEDRLREIRREFRTWCREE